MNAKSIIGFTLAALVGLALAPVATAQPKVVASTAPVAQSGPSNLTVVEEGQQPGTTPRETPRPSRSSGWSAYSDQQAPPAPPTPPVASSAGTTVPQAPPPPPAPPAPSAGTISGRESGPAPKVQMPMIQMPRGQLVNVKVEFTITDQIGTKAPTKKTMTLIVADRENGRIRTNTEYAVARGSSVSYRIAPLGVDVFPTIDGSKIRLEFTLEYELRSDKDADMPPDAQGPKTNVTERLSAVLDSGVPLIIAQSSDAVTDRKLTIEVKATIVK